VSDGAIDIDTWHEEYSALFQSVIPGDDASLEAAAEKIGRHGGKVAPIPRRIIKQDLFAVSGLNAYAEPSDRVESVKLKIALALKRGRKRAVIREVLVRDAERDFAETWCLAVHYTRQKQAKELAARWEQEDEGEVDGPLYADVAQALDEGVESPVPTIGTLRTDGWALLYAAAVNILFGPPEAGKTLVALAQLADVIKAGGLGVFLDLDHNGLAAILARLIEFGVPLKRLRDVARFRYASPAGASTLDRLVADLAVERATDERPVLIVVDSIGELIPMLGGDSNDSDDYTAIHRRALTALTVGGAAVLAIDHEAKAAESRSYGATGATAKKRAVDGIMLRVSIVEPFAPGKGGAASLSIVKDRHGGVRAITNTGGAEPVAGVFRLTSRDSKATWEIHPGRSADMKLGDDVRELLALDQSPTSKTDVMKRMGWGSDRSQKAIVGYRAADRSTLPIEKENQ
jgi:hypothetical protein